VIRPLAGGFGGLAVAASAAALAAWAPPGAADKTPAFAVGLDVVEVTVTARDAGGALVGDLRPEDFALREDGREQEVLIFAPAARPERREELALNLGMLFDTSGSMRRNLRLSQESAVRFLDAIPRARDLLLLFFDRDIRLSRYSSENQQGIFGRILETQGEGETALYDAIAVYLSRVADTPGRKVLILFTDGDDTASRVSPEQVMRMLRASSVTVYPVEFPGERPAGTTEAIRAHSFLAGLAEASGARLFRPQASRELAAIYRSILEDLSGQYVIGYVSDNPARDGRFRRIALEVRRAGIKLRYRPGYEVPKNAAFSKRKR
jgi:Ca-activated chloride channel family protein